MMTTYRDITSEQDDDLLDGDVIYDLVGVMHHKGGSASHGHYTAEYKHDETGR